MRSDPNISGIYLRILEIKNAIPMINRPNTISGYVATSYGTDVNGRAAFIFFIIICGSIPSSRIKLPCSKSYSLSYGDRRSFYCTDPEPGLAKVFVKAGYYYTG